MSGTLAANPEAVVSATQLRDQIQAKASPLADTFETQYAAWKQTWANSTQGEEDDGFNKVASLEPKVIPLVVHKLCDEGEAPAIVLYNNIEIDVKFQSDSCAAIINSNYERNKVFSQNAKGWHEFKTTVFSNTSTDYIDWEEFKDLVELGPSVVANAMLAYYDDEYGWWEKLLSKLMSGHDSGARVIFRRETRTRWINWFEHKGGGGDDSPYKLQGEAAKLEQFMRKGGQGCDYAELA